LGEGIKKGCSPALLAAQQQLLSLREQHRAQNHGVNSPSNSGGRIHYPASDPKESTGQLPDHLGWGSNSLTRAIRKTQTAEATASCNDPEPEQIRPRPATQDPAPTHSPTPSSPKKFVKLYPDITLGMLKNGQEAAGRIWLLLHYIDEAGRGWIDGEEARVRLTQKESPLRVCGRRQLRKLLSRGEGLFWRRDKGRLWLRSTTKVAADLSVYHLNRHPVALPVADLLQGIGLVRAHFYTAFHSGRNEKNKNQSKPISRTRLNQISQVSRRSQRRYEKQASVTRQNNFAIGRRVNAGDFQEQAWQRGRAVFNFIDYAGKMGQKGGSYTAWQLPNNYLGPHKPLPKGRQKRMNQELADLFMKGMTGNGSELVQEDPAGESRRFYDQGQSAATTYNRSPDQDVFWRSRFGRADRFQLWHVLPAQTESRGRCK
jgi:hypothetical protein